MCTRKRAHAATRVRAYTSTFTYSLYTRVQTSRQTYGHKRTEMHTHTHTHTHTQTNLSCTPVPAVNASSALMSPRSVILSPTHWAAGRLGDLSKKKRRSEHIYSNC